MRKPPSIKICGMRDPENIKAVSTLGPDYLGFILYSKSRRCLGANYKLESTIPESIKKVGVFVNAPQKEILEWKERLAFDLVQLHGNESPAYCGELRSHDLQIIKAFGVGAGFSFDKLIDYQAFVDFFLFDTKTSQYGGSGKQFNWEILKNYTLEKPFFLSGGIGPDDVSALKDIEINTLHAIDINSRFESEPALKNVEALRKFIEEFRH